MWRTPGSDGGRDIEGFLIVNDPTGFKQVQKWHIECKRYKRTINWQTIWDKLSHADALDVDVLFLVTNSTPSPKCESRISNWNESRRRPAIRVWKGYNFPKMLYSNVDISIAHGILKPEKDSNNICSTIALTLANVVHCAHGSIAANGDATMAIEAASALSELLEHRLQDLQKYGKFVRGPEIERIDDYHWLEVLELPDQTEDVSFRALITLLRHFSKCDSITAYAKNKIDWMLELQNSKVSQLGRFQDYVSPISHWLRYDDLVLENDYRFRARMRIN